MNDTYTLPQIKKAWEKYRDKANTVMVVKKDGEDQVYVNKEVIQKLIGATSAKVVRRRYVPCLHRYGLPRSIRSVRCRR